MAARPFPSLIISLLVAATSASAQEPATSPPIEGSMDTGEDVSRATVQAPAEVAPLPRPATAPAGDVAVFVEPGYRVEPDTARLAGRFLSESYAAACNTTVADAAAAAEWRAQAGSLDAAAAGFGGGTVLSLELIALDDQLLVSAGRYDAPFNPLRPLRKLKVTASGVAELPVVSERLAGALCRNVPLEESQSYDSILAEEARPTKKVFGEVGIGARLTAAMPVSIVPLQPIICGSVDVRWEAESFFLEIGAGAAVPAAGAIKDASAYGGVYADLGAAYFLYAQETGVYVGGGLHPSLMAPNNGDLGVHLAPYAEVGIELLRYSTARVVIEARVAQHVIPFVSRADIYSYDENGNPIEGMPERTYFPTEPQLAFAILF